jgi:hypothetical protein
VPRLNGWLKATAPHHLQFTFYMQNLPLIEAVIINWKRPENVALIVEALRNQTVPCTITICDCHPSPEFSLDEKTRSMVDRVYRWEHNLGAFSRYVPLAGYDHQFTYLTDDDLVPGPKCLEHFLKHSNLTDFGVLGQKGRRIGEDGTYNTERVKRSRKLEEVDIIIQAYFVQTKNLCHVPRLRWEMGVQTQTDTEDDIIICVAMQLYANLNCYLTPKDSDKQTRMNYQELPTPHALSQRTDHRARRTAFAQEAAKYGWRTLHERTTGKTTQKVKPVQQKQQKSFWNFLRK